MKGESVTPFPLHPRRISQAGVAPHSPGSTTTSRRDAVAGRVPTTALSTEASDEPGPARHAFCTCGNRLGRVDKVEASSIKLARDSSPDGQHHYVPMDWVARVDLHVHLNKGCGEAKKEWGAAPVGAGA